MKKIYSIVLMAAALLIGTNVNATTVADIQNAIDEAAVGATVDIQLNSDVEIAANEPIRIYAKKAETGKTVNLDLNGHMIKNASGAKPASLFYLYKGKLNIKGEGTIINDGGKATIIVYGYEDRAATDWSVLNVGKDVSIQNTVKEAIAVYGFIGAQYYNQMSLEASAYFNKHWDGVEAPYHIYDQAADYKDNFPKTAKAKLTGTVDALVTAGKIDYTTTFPRYYKASATATYATNTTDQAAFGVKINVEGKVHGHEYAIKINGNVRYGRQDATDQIPYVFIAPTAEASCDANYAEGTALYSSGYGKWDIQGYVHGNIGVTIKGGEVSIKDAVIESNSTCPHQDYTSSNSGITGGQGSAILVVSDAAYLGGQSVTISGDTRVSSTNGYAVEEVITTKVDETKVSQINIDGGTFEGGAQGALRFEDNTVSSDKVTVYGGNVEGNVHVGDAEDQLSTLIPTGSHITEIVVDGQTILAISAGAAPTGYATIADHADESVKWTGDKEALDDDLDLVELEINENKKQELTVKAGVTLTVDRVVLGEKAQIIVEAGGMFVVKGTQGIVAPKTSNIILQTSASAQALFLFNPAVTSNRHPNATVELITKAFNNGGSYVWERIGCPAFEGMKAGDIVKNVTSYIQYWDDKQGKYVGISGANHVLLPFQGLSLTNDATAAGEKYQFPCSLVGNDNGKLNLVGKWTSFANSYTAQINILSLLTALKDMGNDISAAAYLYEPLADNWTEISLRDLEDKISGIRTVLDPMQAFIFNLANTSLASADAEINYQAAVWENVFPKTGSGVAARHDQISDLTRAIITITGANGKSDKVTLRQSDEFSAEFDNGADMNKHMGLNSSRIYANTEIGEMAQVADNNIMGMHLSVATENETSFTMTFSNLCGEQLAIRDNLTGSVINMVEGAEYRFTVAENSVNDRFEIVAIHNAPTAVENVANIEGAKAVYTILGQYMGTTDNWNVLPAGIYVVDGVKMVK